MRPADEIKNGLECCSNVNFVCNEECPYYKSLSEGEDCCLKKNADALALIQQLQAENAEKDWKIQQLEATVSEKEKVVAELSGKIGQLESQNRCFKENKESCEKRMVDLAQRMPRWISVEERLPENGTHVLAAVKFSGQFSSGGYVCDAFYAERYAISSEFGDELACEYCEEKDEYFLERGWYEVIKNWDDYASVTIADTVTHWMPLPSTEGIK